MSSWLKTLEAEIRYRVQKEQEAFERQGALLLGAVAPSFLIESASLFQPSHYQDVVIERSLSGICGYPLCSQEVIKSNSTQKFHISLSKKKVYDLEEMRCYCSEECLISSRLYISQLEETPVYLRTNPTPVILDTQHPRWEIMQKNKNQEATVNKDMDIIGFIKEGKKEIEEKKKQTAKESSSDGIPKKSAKKPSKKSASSKAAKKPVKKTITEKKETQAAIPPKREDIQITENEKVQVSTDFPKTDSHTLIDGVHVGIKSKSAPKNQSNSVKMIEQMLSSVSIGKEIPTIMDYGISSDTKSSTSKEEENIPTQIQVEKKISDEKPEKRVHFAENTKKETKEEKIEEKEEKEEDDIFQPKYTPFKYEFSNFGTIFSTLESWCTQLSKLYLQGKEDLMFSTPSEETLATITAPSSAELRRQAMISMLSQHLPFVCSKLSITQPFAEKEILHFSRTFSFTKAVDSLTQQQWIVIILVLLEILTERNSVIKNALHKNNALHSLLKSLQIPQDEFNMYLIVFRG